MMEETRGGRLDVNRETKVWGIRGGTRPKLGRRLFLEEQVAAIDEDCMPDLSQLPQTREIYKALYQPLNPDLSPTQVGIYVGHLHTFVNDIERGDLMVYPDQMDEKIHIGQVISEYFYVECCYQHRRRVKWLPEGLPKAGFTATAFTNSARFFPIVKHAEEFKARWKGTS